MVALAGMAASCGQDPEPGPRPQPPGTVVLEGEAATDRGSSDVADGDRIVIQAGEFFFDPTVILGPPEAAVTVRFTAGGGLRHNITFASIDEDLETGQTVEVELTFPSSGTAVFYCSYHRARGMLGALVAA